MHQLNNGTHNFTYPSAYAASQEKDMQHYGERLQATDMIHFIEAMKKEANGIADVLEIISKSTIPPGQKPLPAGFDIINGELVFTNDAASHPQ